MIAGEIPTLAESSKGRSGPNDPPPPGVHRFVNKYFDGMAGAEEAKGAD